jgi:regulatory LuxR family protein
VLAARGLSNRQIARELHLAEATVKRHLANVYEERTRNEAVRRTLEEQWISLHEITSADGSDGQRRLIGRPGALGFQRCLSIDRPRRLAPGTSRRGSIGELRPVTTNWPIRTMRRAVCVA